MITVFFGADGIALLGVLPTGAKTTSNYVRHNIVEALEQVFYPDRQVPGTIDYLLHLDHTVQRQSPAPSDFEIHSLRRTHFVFIQEYAFPHFQ
jgi:hypothetical protein